MTIEEHNRRKAGHTNCFCWFAMISMTMMFAGLTSAFVVVNRDRLVEEFEMPSAFL
jgi:cytochrome c oxidase subunit 3